MHQISEASSGYVIGFHVFTNDIGINNVLLPEYEHMKKTSTITMSMMKRFFFLDKGHCLFMDNYYTSLELFQELEKKKTLACGTVQSNRKCIPQALRSTGNKTHVPHDHDRKKKSQMKSLGLSQMCSCKKVSVYFSVSQKRRPIE